MLARGEVEIGRCYGDRRTQNQVLRGCPVGLVKPHVLVATRVAVRRQLGGSVVGFEGRDVPVRFMVVTMMRDSMR